MGIWFSNDYFLGLFQASVLGLNDLIVVTIGIFVFKTNELPLVCMIHVFGYNDLSINYLMAFKN
jgi:hypothetical protein